MSARFEVLRSVRLLWTDISDEPLTSIFRIKETFYTLKTEAASTFRTSVDTKLTHHTFVIRSISFQSCSSASRLRKSYWKLSTNRNSRQWRTRSALLLKRMFILGSMQYGIIVTQSHCPASSGISSELTLTQITFVTQNPSCPRQGHSFALFLLSFR